MFELNPAVFAVGREYQIMVPVQVETTMWVQIGDQVYWDESNGVLRSNTFLHKVCVPMEVLNQQGKYTVYLREVTERKPYFTETKAPVWRQYSHRLCEGKP